MVRQRCSPLAGMKPARKFPSAGVVCVWCSQLQVTRELWEYSRTGQIVSRRVGGFKVAPRQVDHIVAVISTMEVRMVLRPRVSNGRCCAERQNLADLEPPPQHMTWLAVGGPAINAVFFLDATKQTKEEKDAAKPYVTFPEVTLCLAGLSEDWSPSSLAGKAVPNYVGIDMGTILRGNTSTGQFLYKRANRASLVLYLPVGDNRFLVWNGQGNHPAIWKDRAWHPTRR